MSAKTSADAVVSDKRASGWTRPKKIADSADTLKWKRPRQIRMAEIHRPRPSYLRSPVQAAPLRQTGQLNRQLQVRKAPEKTTTTKSEASAYVEETPFSFVAPATFSGEIQAPGDTDDRGSDEDLILLIQATEDANNTNDVFDDLLDDILGDVDEEIKGTEQELPPGDEGLGGNDLGDDALGVDLEPTPADPLEALPDDLSSDELPSFGEDEGDGNDSIDSLLRDDADAEIADDTIPPIDAPQDGDRNTVADDTNSDTTDSSDAASADGATNLPDLGRDSGQPLPAMEEDPSVPKLEPTPLGDDSEFELNQPSAQILSTYNGRDCPEEERVFQSAWDELRQTPISSISLDITPSIQPTAPIEQINRVRERNMSEAPARAWRDRNGRLLADGKMVNYENGRVEIQTPTGQLDYLSWYDLSNEDLCFVSAWWELPSEFSAATNNYVPRNWTMTTFTWTASALCHKPLYFEDVQLERYGHSAGPMKQAALSGVHFFGNILFLPYHMGLNPPNECQYALGYYRPGSCAPWLVPAVPLSARGARWQLAALVGGLLIIP